MVSPHQSPDVAGRLDGWVDGWMKGWVDEWWGGGVILPTQTHTHTQYVSVMPAALGVGKRVT